MSAEDVPLQGAAGPPPRQQTPMYNGQFSSFVGDNRLVSVPLGAAASAAERVDPFLADNEQLRKQGRFGKFVASNRAAALCCVVGLAMLGIGSLLWLSGAYFLGSVRLVAAGVRYEFGQSELEHSAVRLGDGTLVERVIEPRAPIGDHYHALLMLTALRKAGAAGRLTPDAVARGYANWTVSSVEAAQHNFTFDGTAKLARSVADDAAQRAAAGIDAACVCYAELGLPYNIVYVRSVDEVLYEPRIEADKWRSPVAQVRDRGRLARLLREARVYAAQLAEGAAPDDGDAPPGAASRVARAAAAAHASSTDALVSAVHGTVAYVRRSGRQRRRMFDDDDQSYVCIKQCVSHFDAAIVLDGSDRERLHGETEPVDGPEP